MTRQASNENGKTAGLTMPATIRMWHGGRRWDGAPEIRTSTKGKAERGPGIYCTTNYQTARKYAAGGGQVRLLEFAPARLLEETAIPLADAEAFVLKTLIKRTHADTIERLRDSATRRNMASLRQVGNGPHVPASVLNNLCVNSDQAHGAKGLALNAFLVSYGIDASFESAHGNETWGVIINPDCISSSRPVKSEDVSLDDYELPRPDAQAATHNLQCLAADVLKPAERAIELVLNSLIGAGETVLNFTSLEEFQGRWTAHDTNEAQDISGEQLEAVYLALKSPLTFEAVMNGYRQALEESGGQILIIGGGYFAALDDEGSIYGMDSAVDGSPYLIAPFDFDRTSFDSRSGVWRFSDMTAENIRLSILRPHVCDWPETAANSKAKPGLLMR